MRKILILVFVTCLAVTSCKDGASTKQDFTPASIGQVNSLTVVMSNELWEGKVGDNVRDQFAKSVVGIAWNEPIFTLRHLPETVFTGAVRKSRSILVVQKKDTTSLSYINKNTYSRPQNVAVIVAPTEDELIETINKNADHIISEFNKTDLQVTQGNFKRSLLQDTSIEDMFGVTMDIPSVYSIGKVEDNFIWLDRDIKNGTMNLIVYALPWDSFSNNATFISDIVSKRDSIGKKYIPGPNEGTYMDTEKAFAPSVFPAEIGGEKAAEIRGRWEIYNYSMAGPYVSYIINDKENNRKLVVEGFTFAPAAVKRDFMFELEAIIKTLKFLPKKASS
ncbi:uncharacterized protein DUF4837 [Cellulophaga sp. RHA_52]|uniref:DUF4837 family protein n=1 Tax=Cellulophaga sp. RHA_52 TaxID=1250036 RepID=UPI001199184A|nr:DUF4837 family protein [Cellulophaga sp. RHA_52]TVZ08267.1 uncharacterized protein DUF4837 [Cellulophaga sp. RHA_52]